MARGRPSLKPKRSADSLASNVNRISLDAPRRTRSRASAAARSEAEDFAESRPSSARPNSRTLLKEVAIRNITPKTTRASVTKEPSLSTNSTESLSSRGTSVDYETPQTSLSTTPATITETRKTRVSVRQTGKISGKGKEPVFEVSESEQDEINVLCMPESSAANLADYALAKALQEQEYGIEDTDDNLSSLDSDSFSVDEPVNKKRKLSNNAGASSSRRSRPSRPASAKARKSLALADSDDESAFTLSDSEDEFELDEMDEDEQLDATLMDTDADDLLIDAGNSGISPAGSASKAQSRPPKTKDRKKKRYDTAENRARQRRFMHIQDRWERKRAMNRDKLEEAHLKLRTMWDDLGNVAIIKPIQAPQPASITRKLKSFQLEGLDWMVKQEKTHYKGGLLGDEMGMGKTIQAVSLIMSDYPAKDPTLVVVPPVALMQWSNEIREYTDGTLKVLVFHGTNSKVKNLSVKELKKYDVIIVSYNSLESLYRKEVKGWSRGENIVKENSHLHAIHFHRLILDEAHSIKSRVTGVAKACFALKGTYKWCLSGTPVQNRIGEFFSLLRFLEVRPFADYFCRACKCEQLHWSLDEDHMCPHCKHSGAEHVSVFNQELLNPITGDNIKLRAKALDKLHMITARIMLRRMKRDHTSSMELPPKEIDIHNEFFGEIERDFSSSIMTNSSRKFDTYVSQGVMLNNYANIFGLIMQMRQVANHPDLLLKKHNEGGQNILVCEICDEPAEEAVRSRCHHEFCRACIKQYIRSSEGSGGSPDCPRCHIPLSIDLEQPDIEQDEEMVRKSSIINRIKMEDWTSSTKIEMLVYELYKLRSRKQTLKSIVFSQFTSMLQLIEWRLRRAGFNTVMLDGSMTPTQRQRSIDYFMNNADVEVFLVSLKAGGVALNLTEASRVFIVDPWWNPAAEWQSADRCHRIGQRRPCVITRLVIEDSVESRMVLLQEKKAAMIAGTVNNDKVAMEKLSPEDLQFLFRGT